MRTFTKDVLTGLPEGPRSGQKIGHVCSLLVLLAFGVLGCQEGVQGEVSRYDDLGAPSAPAVDAGMEQVQSPDMSTAANVGAAPASNQPSQACQRDRDCPITEWCNSDGECQEPIAKWVGPIIEDGLTRAGAASFDLVPDGFEGWTDKASQECPDNRPGYYDGVMKARDSARPCEDTFDDVDGDGTFSALWLGGRGMDRPASGIDMDNPPEGRVLVFSKNERVHVVTTLDVHAIGPGAINQLLKLVRARTGLSDDALSIHVTGNRSGPDAVGLSGPSWKLNSGGHAREMMRQLRVDDDLLGTIPVQTGLSEAWLSTVSRRMAAAITQAAMAQRPIEVRSGSLQFPIDEERVTGELELSDDNGNSVGNDSHDVLTWRRMKRAFVREPTLPGRIDRDLRIISLDDVETGRSSILIIGWGAAPAMTSRQNLLSADYPGLVRRQLENEHPEATAVWLTSAASDTMVADDQVVIPKTGPNGDLLDRNGNAVNMAQEAEPSSEPMQALATFIAQGVPRALEGQPKRLADLNTKQRLVWLPIANPRYGLAAWLGILPKLDAWLSGRSNTDRWASAELAPGCGGLGCIRTRIDRVDLADDVRLLMLPGAFGQGYVTGRTPVTIHYGGARNLADIDGDGIDDTDDEELMVRGRLGAVENTYMLDAPVNPQRIDGVDGLGGPDTWVIGRTNGGVGSIRSPSQFVNVFEGQLDNLERFARRQGNGRLQLCKWGYPCTGDLNVQTLLNRAHSALPNILANLMASRELWCEGEIPHLPTPTEWRIESPTGDLRAQGSELTIGVNKVAYAPDVNFVSLGIEPGDKLILPEWESRWWPIGGIVPIELRQHVNASDTLHSIAPAAGDLVYQAACELLDMGGCAPPADMADDPNRALPSAP